MANKKIEPIEKICPVCNKTFLVGGRGRPSKRQKYDSKRCRALAGISKTIIQTLLPQQAMYIAGLFDGEGSIIMWGRGYGGRPQLRCTISNTFEPIMHWLKSVSGAGSIVKKVHPPEKGYKDGFTWQVYGQNAVSLLNQIMPFLIIKKDKAKEAILSQFINDEAACIDTK